MNFELAYFESPIGRLKIEGNKDGILSIAFTNEKNIFSKNIPESLNACITQIDEYFFNDRKEFDLKLNPQGTAFQKKVWEELQKIPHGKTTTYMNQSKSLENIKAIRAIAATNGKNPISIVIPCHRVIGSDGSLTGYAGGIWRKEWLLEHENPSNQISLFK